jgi:protein-S-isoprenylcysteine O-methyltransferase Ste14
MPVWLRWWGAVLFLIADILFYLVHSYLGHSWSGFIALLDDHKLIKNGPYKYMRHPMYARDWTSTSTVSISTNTF